MDDEPMWAADRVVSPTLGSAITIPETANEFAINGNHWTLVKGNQFDSRAETDHHKHIHEFLRIYDMFKYRDTKNEAVRLMMFPLSLIGEAKTWLDELNEGTIKTRDEIRTAFISRFFTLALFYQLLGEIQAFSQHENKCNIIKIFYHGLGEITQEFLNAAAGGIFLYKTPNQAYQLLEDKVLLKLDWARNQKTKSSLKKTVAFVDEGSSNTDTDKIMARMDSMTIKMDAQYKELQSRAKNPTPDLDDDDMPMSREEEAKFMQTFPISQRFVKETFIDLKTQLKTVAKNHQASIQNLKTKFDRLADKQSSRPSRSLPRNTQPNPRGGNSKAYQPPKARNEHVNVVFTRSGKSYDLPDNPNDQQNNSENPINFDSDDEDDEPTPQPKTQPTKPIKETSLPKPFKPKIPYPQHLRNEKIEAQYGKFLDMIRAVRINDRKGTENVATDHLSLIEKDESSDDSDVDDNFPGETLMEINTKNEPWFADFANYLVADIIPNGLTYQQKNKFFSDLKHYFREEPYLFKKTMKRYAVNHHFSTSYHPQTSGQVENTNRALKIILEKTVKDNPAIWSRKLDTLCGLFALHYQNTLSVPLLPYKLIYGKNCHLPFEIEHRAYWALKNYNPNLIAAGEKKCFNYTD
ncbi:reverse transcriptase domain-containing protein [Tanacetum coccineum]